jgi:release factor glutamine methyltransferase
MQQAIKYIRSELSDIYPDDELLSITRLIISKITAYTFTEILVNKNTIFSQHQRDLLEFYLEKLKKRTPVQYVLGETEFCGLDFVVNEAVLIPRPETEELVEWIVQEANPASVILDIGTGSGCIAVSLKSCLPRTEVYACDISLEALNVARQNAFKNNLPVSFFEMDVLKTNHSERKYDVIVSNPPYIPKSEIASILSQVKDFEPHQALFVPEDDPLLFYRRIAVFAGDFLLPGGKLFFETHRDYARECMILLQKEGFENIVIKKDISGNNRMLRADSCS